MSFNTVLIKILLVKGKSSIGYLHCPYNWKVRETYSLNPTIWFSVAPSDRRLLGAAFLDMSLLSLTRKLIILYSDQCLD